MNTLEEILKEANKYLRPLPEEADPTKMNEEDNIRSIEMRERLEPIERAEFEPRELNRATLGVESPPYTPEELQKAKELNVHPNRIRHTMKIERQAEEDPTGLMVSSIVPYSATTPEMNEEDYIRYIEKLERLEPIERVEFEPRELKRAEDTRSIERVPKQEFKEFEKLTPRRNLQPMRAPEELEKMTPRMNLQPMRVPEETFEDMQLSPLGSGAIMRAQQFMIPEYDPEDQIMYDDIQREQLEYQRRLDYLQKLRERK